MIVNGPGISLREDDIGAEFVSPLPKNPRPKIVALCEHCTNRMLKRDELLPYEYWAFDAAATDEMVDVLLKMKMRKPYTLEAAAKATGMDAEPLEKLLDEMSYIGLSSTTGRIPPAPSSGFCPCWCPVPPSS